jgi:hypothetical protein
VLLTIDSPLLLANDASTPSSFQSVG